MKTTIYRQGDILFIKEESHLTLDQNTQRFEELEIAEGEVTGHHHVARGKELGILLKSGEDIVDFLAPQGCRIEHDEHAPLDLPPGSYKVRRQREYGYTTSQDVMD